MAGAKSLVVLCFLLIIAASQAASCKYSACYWACRKLNLSKAFCAKKCHCSLPSTFFPNELATKEAVLEEMMMMEELSLNDCPTCNVEMTEAMTAEVDYNLAEAVLEEMMMEELSLNESPTFVEEMTEAPTATEMEDDYNLAEAVLEEMMMMEEPSLNECPTCKVKVTEALAAAEMAVDNNLAEAVLEEMMMVEEVISFNDKLTAKCKYNPCYRACRALGGSKDFCAKKCRCTQATYMIPAVSPPSRVMTFKLIILAVALVSMIIGAIILFPRKKAILISYFIKIWNFIGIISFMLKKENKRQGDDKDNKKQVNEEKQSLLPASGTAQVAAQAQEDQGQRSIHGDPHKRLDLQPLVDSEASIAEEDGTLVPASLPE